MEKKVDSLNLDLKVALRRKVITEAGLTSLRVLDLYAGTGKVWTEMRKHYQLDAYVPLDKDPRMPGTIKVDDSSRFLPGFDLAAYNVVDIDPYGTPWPSWDVFSQLIAQRSVVFLTNATIMATRSHYLLKQFGIPVKWERNIPKHIDLSKYAPLYFLTPIRNRCRIVKAYSAVMTNMAYYGLICEPT